VTSVSLWAVHLADGAIAETWIAAGWLGCILLLLRPLQHLREEDIPRLGLLTAAFFVSSSIHIKLAILPTSVHLLLNGLVGVLLGPRAPIAIAIGLLLQYVLLAHGGLTTLGLNTCIIAAPAWGAALLERRLRTVLSPFWRGVLLGGGTVGLTVLLNFTVLLLGGKEDWGVLARLVLLAHIPVVVLEAAMVGVILAYIERVKPELLEHSPTPTMTMTSGPGAGNPRERRKDGAVSGIC
jgi:cobalt/nickel transport system permease protein